MLTGLPGVEGRARVIKEFFDRIRERSWKIYEQYYGNGKYRHHNDRYREEVCLRIGPDTVLLDIGAGYTMPFTRQFAPKVRKAVGLDIIHMQSTSGGPSGVRADIDHLPFKDGTVDAVVSMSVVEHLMDPLTAFREVARVLKPKGVVVLQTPNKYDYVSLIAHFTPFRFHQWLLSHVLDRKVEDIFPTCFRANTRKQMHASLTASGLTPLKIELFNQYPAYLMFWPLLFRIGIYYERLTSRFESLAQLRGWILAVAEKKG